MIALLAGAAIFYLRWNSDRLFLGEEIAQKILNRALSDASDVCCPGILLLSKKEGAIEVAEVYLFNVFGKTKTKSERPYEVYLIDNYWVITGTLPVGMDGGTFQIVLNAKNGRVEQLIHTR